jgi:DNA-binding transcriptional LysR family regulator
MLAARPRDETADLDRSFAVANNRRMEPFAGMEAFARVVEAGSFTAAAQRLQTAKSSISEAVRALEERLGVRLLDRTTRKVRATEAGLIFYARCRRLLEEAEAARAEVQKAGDAPSGTLRVTAPDGFAPRFILPSLGEFLNAHPAIDVELVEAQAYARLVDEGLDLAIRITPKPDDNLVVRRIGLSRTAIVAAPSYLAANPAPKTPEEVAQHRCVGFSPLAWRDTWRIDGRDIAVKPRLLSNNTESLRAAALAGLGLVVLPEWMVADALASGALARVLPDCETPASGIFAAYPTNRLIAPKVRAFVDHLVRELKGRGVGGK